MIGSNKKHCLPNINTRTVTVTSILFYLERCVVWLWTGSGLAFAGLAEPIRFISDNVPSHVVLLRGVLRHGGPQPPLLVTGLTFLLWILLLRLMGVLILACLCTPEEMVGNARRRSASSQVLLAHIIICLSFHHCLLVPGELELLGLVAVQGGDGVEWDS